MKSNRNLGRFETLPDEKLLEAFSFLKRRDLAKLSATSKDLKEFTVDRGLQGLPYAELDYAAYLDGKDITYHTRYIGLVKQPGVIEISDCVALPDKQIAIAYERVAQIAIWDIAQSPGELKSLFVYRHEGEPLPINRNWFVNKLLYLPNGWLVCGHQCSPADSNVMQEFISIWDIQSKSISQPIYTLGRHSRTITDLILISQNQFASASWDGQINIWQLNEKQKPECVKTFSLHHLQNNILIPPPIRFMKKISNNKIISVSLLGNFEVWDLSKDENDLELLRIIHGRHHSEIYGFEVLSEHVFVASLGNGEIFTCDLRKHPGHELVSQKKFDRLNTIKLKKLDQDHFAATCGQGSILIFSFDLSGNFKLETTICSYHPKKSNQNHILGLLPDGRILSDLDGEIVTRRFKRNDLENNNDQIRCPGLPKCNIL